SQVRQAEDVLSGGYDHSSKLQRFAEMHQVARSKQRKIFCRYHVQAFRAQACDDARVDTFVCIEPNGHRLNSYKAQLGVDVLEATHQLVCLRPLAPNLRSMRLVVRESRVHLRRRKVRV